MERDLSDEGRYYIVFETAACRRVTFGIHYSTFEAAREEAEKIKEDEGASWVKVIMK